jgi:antitoxin (DNA-binding transcriptional repressor) of toxin-antitoxin stability system
MVRVSVEDMQRNLSEYLAQVAAGQTLLIVESGRVFAEVKPVAPTGTTKRPVGLCAGEFVVPGDFDDPLPDNVLNAFEGR